MRVLLDTHVAIWAAYEPDRIPAEVSTLLQAGEHTVYISAVSAWEIAIKEAIGKLQVDLDRLVGASTRAGFEQLPVSVGHAQALRGLGAHHTDPFDRLLIAQSVVEGCTIVTRDPSFAAYDVPTMWGD